MHTIKAEKYMLILKKIPSAKKYKGKHVMILFCLIFLVIYVNCYSVAEAKINKKVVLEKGKRYSLKIKRKKQYIFRSSNKKIATVNKNGFVKTAKKGKCHIFAVHKSKKNRNQKYSIQVTGKLELNYKYKNLNIGSTVQLKFSLKNSKGKWKSGNNKIARVDKNGVVTGISVGETEISFQYNNKKYKCQIEVKKKPFFNFLPPENLSGYVTNITKINDTYQVLIKIIRSNFAPTESVIKAIINISDRSNDIEVGDEIIITYFKSELNVTNPEGIILNKVYSFSLKK